MSKYREQICPGCGDTGVRPKGKICHECKKKLRNYDRLEEIASRLNDSGSMCDHYFYEKFPLPYARGISRGEEHLERFRSAILDLVNSLTPIVEVDEGRQSLLNSRVSMDGHSSGFATHSFKSFDGFSDSFSEFSMSLHLLFNHVFSMGRKEGCNLLQQLNDGNISTHDFEDRKNRG